MGLAFSCLTPKTQEVPVKPCCFGAKAGGKEWKDDQVNSNKCSKSGSIDSEADTHDAANKNVTPVVAPALGPLPRLPRSPPPPEPPPPSVTSATSIAPSAFPPHEAPTDESLLDSQPECSTAFSATSGTSLQSTQRLSSCLGYPYASYDLGPPRGEDEPARIQAFRALDILESVSTGRRARLDEEADMVLAAVMQMFRASTAMLVLFDDSRIIIRNSKGIMGPGEFPYRWSFCAYTLTKHRPQTLMIPDATKDCRFADNPFVIGAPGVRFYCGAPLVSSSGHVLGTLCFADTSPRPDFDAGQCCLANNMAELMVRQLERYRANAGPAGPVDAETTALARVARTMECYEAVTGLVDISLQGGWMLMYVNESWEAVCAPWSRKQLVGRRLQNLLELELEPEPGLGPAQNPACEEAEAEGEVPEQAGAQDPDGEAEAVSGAANPTDAAATTTSTIGSNTGVVTQSRVDSVIHGAASCSPGGPDERGSSPSPLTSGGQAQSPQLPQGMQAVSAADRRQWGERRRQAKAAGGGSVGVAATSGGAKVPDAGSEAASWGRFAAALQAGEEVVLPPARLLMPDGRPSTTLVCVTVKPANYHVLDAATRMPIGVPPQTALPPSILGVKAPSTLPSAAPSRSTTQPETRSSPEDGPSSECTTVGPVDAGSVQVESFYCFVTMTPVREGDDGLAGPAEGWPARGSRPPLGCKPSRCDSSGAAGCGSGALACSVTPSQTSWLQGPYVGAYDLSQNEASLRSSANQPSLGRTAALASAVSTGARRPSVDATAGARRRPSLDNNPSTAAGEGGHSGRGSAFAPGGLAAFAAAVAAGGGHLPSASGSARGGRFTGMAQSVQSIASWTYGMEPVLGLRLGHMLGKGGYGRVFAATYKGQRVAAKVISNAMLKSSTCINGVTLEALLAQEIEHPYIVRTYKCVVRWYQLSSGQPSLTDLGVVGRRSSLATTLPGGPSVALPSAGPSEISSLAGGGASPEFNGRPGCVGSPCGTGAGSVGKADPGSPAVADAVPTPAVAPMVATAAAPAGPQPVSVAGGTAAEQQVEGEVVDYDSFDAVGDEGAGGMIDQLESGQPAPSLGPSYAPPSYPGMSACSNLGVQRAVDCLSPGGGAGLTATADAEQLEAAAAAGVHGAPPQLPPGTAPVAGGSAAPGPAAALAGGGSVAELSDAYGAATVFGSDAAAAAAAAAGVSYRPGGRPDVVQDGETWILQEFCTGGTLQDAVDTGRLRSEASRLRGQPHLPAILLTAQEIASAMQCLHSRGYMHGDLSAVNVLLTDPSPGAGEGPNTGGKAPRGWVAKVSDFGLAKHLPDPNRPHVSATFGVITHCAPEVLKAHTQTQRADVYSFGVLLWQMWTGARPWANMNRFQILGAIASANSPGLRFLPTQLPPEPYRDLTMRCLSHGPASRPSFAEICEELRIMTYQAATEGLLKG